MKPFSFLALFVSALTLAQTPQATISGVVTDPQGAVIPGVEVVATNTQTHAKTHTQTNEAGFYSLPSLPIGSYILTAKRAGFRRYVREAITLSTGQALEMNISLDVGPMTESVTVSARASALETRTSDVSQLVESKTIEDMPLGDRRAMNMIKITGAAVFVNYDNGQKPNFSLAGGRTQSQMFWIDGGTGQNMRLGIGQIDMDPPAEVIQEVKVLSNNYSAEYGGSAGGVIVATTKSGANRLRGGVFEYLRNDKLDAADFFAPVVAGQKVKAPLRYNVFGGTIGGPIRRDKTFFFFAYEGSRRRNGSIRTLTVPTELQKRGDFSQTLDARGKVIPIYDPSTTRVVGGQVIRDTFPGNRIDPSRFDPAAVKILSFYPLANRAPDNITAANNFRSNFVTGLTRNNFTVKVDHNRGSKDKFTARYLYNSDDRDNTSVFPIPAAETLNDSVAHQQYWYGSWTRTLSASLVNEFRFTYGNRTFHQTSKGLGGKWPSQIGIRGVPDNAFPHITASGLTALGPNSQERRQFPIQQYQFVDSLSWVHGRHALKFGGEVRPSYNLDVFLPTVSGSFTFDLKPTGLPGVANSGNGLASLLLGFPTAFSARQTEPLDRSTWYLAGFVQDDWTVHTGLTVNVGVRWETDTSMVDANNRLNGFDAAAMNPVSRTPGVVRFAGVDSWRVKPYDTDWNNFGPRFGFAWKPLGAESTVVRGGYGIFYAHPFDHAVPNAASLGFELSASLNSPDNGITAPFFLKDGVPGLATSAPALNDSFGAVATGKNPTTAVTFFETNRRTGYSQQFNLGVQHELPGGVIFELSYVGNLSRKLASSNLSINQIRPERLGPAATQKDRPFPQFSNVSIVAPTLGVASYHAGVVRVEKRFSRGLNFLSTYTWSKFIDNVDEGGATLGQEGGAYSNFYNRRADRGPSENDIRHRFTWSSVYEIPVGENKRFLANHPARFLLGGWSIGSVITIQSGAPFTVTTQDNTTNAFSAGALRADVLRDPNLPSGRRSLNRWFDTDAFRQPAAFTFGNQGKDILRADGISTFDFSILRSFALSEDKRLQFRGEFFNAFNHPNFSVPGRVLGAPGFGIVSSAGRPREIQLGLRLTF